MQSFWCSVGDGRGFMVMRGGSEDDEAAASKFKDSLHFGCKRGNETKDQKFTICNDLKSCILSYKRRILLSVKEEMKQDSYNNFIVCIVFWNITNSSKKISVYQPFHK